jgi:hypothetical protein
MLGAQVERVTNHDVKAIEYVIKRRLQGSAELARVRILRASATRCGERAAQLNRTHELPEAQKPRRCTDL